MRPLSFGSRAVGAVHYAPSPDPGDEVHVTSGGGAAARDLSGCAAARVSDRVRRHEAQEAAAKSPALPEPFDLAPVALAITEGAKHWVRYANPAMLAFSAIEQDYAVGRPLAELLPHAEVAHALPLLDEVYRTHVPQESTSPDPEGAADSGPVQYWNLTAWPLPDRPGQAAGLVVELRDVTTHARERRLRERISQQLRRMNQQLIVSASREKELRHRADEASRAKSSFLALMSHELRTPLSAILGYQGLLAEGITGPVNDPQRAQLSRIKASATHLLSLIDEILTLSQVEAGQELVHWAPVDLGELAHEAAALIAPMAAQKGLVVNVHAPDEPIELESDRLKVIQILGNVLSNAVRFGHRGGVDLEARVEDDAATFTVRDVGVGIASEHLEKVFDPFWQIEQMPTRRMGGSGLGLSVARGLARLLGGDLTVASTLGEGSTFTLSLPLHRPVSADPASERPA